MSNFTEYMLSFYGSGPHAIYPLGFTREQIKFGTQLYRSRLPQNEEFCGDSVDRERVRDIIINTYYPELK